MAKLSSLGKELQKQRKKFGTRKRVGATLALVLFAGLVSFGSTAPTFAAYLDEMIGTYIPTTRTPDAWDNTYPFMNDNPDGLQVTLSSYQRDYNLSEQEGSAVYNASIDVAPRHLVSGFFSALSDFNKPVTVAIDFSGLVDDASEYQIADELTDAGSSVDPDKYTIEKDGNIVTITLERGLFMAELIDIMMSMSPEDAQAMNSDMMAIQEQWDIDYPDGVPDEVMRAAFIALLEEHLSSYVNDPDTRDWGLMYDEMMGGPSELIQASLQFSVRYPYIGPEQPDYLGDGKLTATATVCQGVGVTCEPQSYASCDELSTSGTRCVRLAEYGYPTLASYDPDGWAGVQPLVSMNTSLLTRFSSANPVRYTEQMQQELDNGFGGNMLTEYDTVIIGFHQSYLEDNQESSYDVDITSLLDDFDIESQFYYRYSASGSQTFMADPPDPSYGTVEIVDGHIKVWTKNVPGSEDVILGLKLTPKQTGDGIIKLTQRTCVAWPGETATTAGCVAPEQSPNAHNAGLTTGEVIYTISRYKLIQSYEVEGGGPVLPGSTVKFTTTVQNLIGSPATGAVNLDLRRLLDHVEWLDDVEVNYPQGAAGGGQWWGNLGRNKLDTYFHQLAPHASSTMNFTVKVNEDTPVGTDLDVLSWYCDPYTGCESETEMCAFEAEGSALSEVRCTGGWYSYWSSDVGVVHETEEEIAGAARFAAFIEAGIPTACSSDDKACSQASLTVQSLDGGGEEENPDDNGDGTVLDKALAVEDTPVDLDSSKQTALTVTNKPYFSGKTEKPFTPVTVTVHSDPVSCSTTSDVNGNWSCMLPTTIPSGTHTAYVYLTDPDTNAVITLGPYSLMVNGGDGTTITDSTKVGAPNSGVGIVIDLVGSIVLVAILVILPTGYALYYRRQATTRQ